MRVILLFQFKVSNTVSQAQSQLRVQYSEYKMQMQEHPVVFSSESLQMAISERRY